MKIKLMLVAEFEATEEDVANFKASSLATWEFLIDLEGTKTLIEVDGKIEEIL